MTDLVVYWAFTFFEGQKDVDLTQNPYNFRILMEKLKTIVKSYNLVLFKDNDIRSSESYLYCQ